MKRLLTYSLTGLAILLLTLSCSRTEIPEPGETNGGTGKLTLRITGSRTQNGSYDPFDYITVRIFNGENTLVRKYTSQQSIPATLELLSGDYRITVEAGDLSQATFTNRSYFGEKAFTITAGATQQVEVTCKSINTAAQVKFDATVDQNFGTDFKAVVCAADTFDADAVANGDVPALEYTSDKTGYFILPEGVQTLSWRFTGVHPKQGEIVKSGVIEEVKPGYKYTLSLRYSPDLPGYIDITVKVDTTTDDVDDTIIFSPDPVIKGSDFNLNEIQKYISGEKSFDISSMGALATVELDLDGVTYDLLNPTQAGIVAERKDAYSVTVKLGDALFAGRQGGNHTLGFRIADADGGKLTTETVFRLQGLLPVAADDCDLWKNTATLHAVVMDEAISKVGFSFRKTDGEWAETEGVRSGETDIYTATFDASWNEETNAAGLTVYKPVPGSGIFAGGDYEYKVAFNDVEAGNGTVSTQAGIQSISDGNMEDPNLGCFKTSSGPFWGSGNNSFAKGLCNQSTYNGMEGAHCAKLSASKPALAVDLAAGNLFTGMFAQEQLTTGVVSFGVGYDWQARPRAISVRYFAKLGAVNANQHGGPLPNGSPDKARIFAAIVDWDNVHVVKSGTSAPSGLWDPAAMNSVGEGAIIGYGSLFIEGSTEGDSMLQVELPIHYYDTQAKPGKRYSLVISCATSAYGDYMNGCTTNVLYVDDFKWVY